MTDDKKKLEALQTVVQDDELTGAIAFYLSRAARRARKSGDPEAVFSIHHHRGAIIGALANARDELALKS